jgi:plasmid replication initiation protein
MFSWIDGWEDLVDMQTKESRGITLTVSDWFYRGVTEDGGVLAIDFAYFSITGGRERWLYRVARKHAGGNGAEGRLLGKIRTALRIVVDGVRGVGHQAQQRR